jgi:hypothetical protein
MEKGVKEIFAGTFSCVEALTEKFENLLWQVFGS